MEISSFARILNKLQQKSDKLDTKLRYLKLCIDNDNMRTAYEQAAALEDLRAACLACKKSASIYRQTVGRQRHQVYNEEINTRFCRIY